MLKKITIGSVIMLLVFVMGGLIMHKSVVSWRWNNFAGAAGGMPFQVGLTNVIVTPCTTSGYTCTGGTLCNLVDSADCSLYEDVNGSSAGGTGQPPLLLSIIAASQTGLSSGGQLIYGGTTNSMYISPDASLASVGGCYGSACAVGPGITNKIYAWLEKLDKFIIAGFRKSQK